MATLMRKPKIGFLIPRLGITDRGAEVFVYELAHRLKKDFDVTIWVRKSNDRSALIEDLVKRGITIKQVSCIREQHWISRLLNTLPFLRRLLEEFHITPSEIEMLSFSIVCLPQILSNKLNVLFPVNGVWGAMVCRLVKKIKGTPFAYASQGGIEPLIARQKPNAYVAINPVIAEWLRKHFVNLWVEFIPNGVDLETFHPKGERVLTNLSRPIFLTVSALVPEKRVDLTIKAVSKLKKGSLLVIGDGPLRSELMQLSHKTLGEDRYLFLRIDHKKLPKYYRAADVFAFSAPWEVGWSMVHLEALASGLPVVANREENLEYLLGKDWPLFCNVNDAVDYSRVLEKATTIKVESRSLVKNYSWDKVAKKYREVLLRIINEYKKKD